MQVGFIGLGTMGSAVARNIQRAGFDMVVHDLRKEAGHPGKHEVQKRVYHRPRKKNRLFPGEIFNHEGRSHIS